MNRVTLMFNKGRLLDVFLLVSTCSKFLGDEAKPSLSKNEGLLVSFNKPSHPMVWNKGVGYAVSVLYIGSNMKISNIVDLDANSKDVVLCQKPVRYILEISKRAKEMFDFKVGDFIEDLIRN